MAIDSMDDLVAGLLPYGIPFLKQSFTPQAASSWHSLWTIAGIPGAGVNASSGVAGDIPTDATAGAFPFTNPVSGNSYLARFSTYGTQVGQLLLYDRLWQQSGLSPTTVGNQTVQATTPLVPLTRPDQYGASAEAWLQIFGVMGAGASLPTITYTDQSGNSGNTGTCTLFAATAAATRTFPFALAAGDTGVSSIQFYDNIGSHTSGTFGLIIRRFISSLSVPIANTSDSLDPITGGLPRIYNDACLELLVFASSTASQTVGGSLSMAQG